MIQQRLIVLIVSVFVLLANNNAVATPNPVNDKTLIVNEVRPSEAWIGGQISSITQDERGYMWISSDKALHRFDGVHRKAFTYQVNGTPSDLPHRDIITIYADKQGYLWLASTSGLSRLNLQTETFEVMADLTLFRKPHFVSDNANNVWYINDRDIYVYYHTEQKFTKIDLHEQLSEIGFNDIAIANYVLVDEHNILIRTADACLLYNISNNTAREHTNRQLRQVCRSNVFMRKVGNWLYLRSPSGDVYRYSLSDNKLHKILTLPQAEISSAIVSDTNNRLWFGNYGSLALYDPFSKQTSRIEGILAGDRYLESIGVNALYMDDQGQIWFADKVTNSVYVYDPEVETFNHGQKKWPHFSGYQATEVTALLHSKNGHLWYTPNKKDIIQLNLNTGQTQHYPLPDKDLYTYELRQSDNNSLWLASSKGLYLATITGQDIAYKKVYPTDTKPIAITALTIDSNQRLWFGTNGRGLSYFDIPDDLDKNLALAIKPVNSLKKNLYIDHLHSDSQQRLWIGTISGLYLIRDDSTLATQHFSTKRARGNLCHRAVHHITSSNQNVWISTQDGFGLFNEQTQTFNCFRDTEFPNNNTIQGIIVDNEREQLWLSTTAGLLRSDFSGTITARFLNQAGFYAPLLTGSAIKIDSTLWLGTRKGLNSVSLTALAPTKILERFRLSELRSNNALVGLHYNSNQLSQGLQFEYEQNDLTLNFANLDYKQKQPLHYQMRLHDDQQWKALSKSSNVFLPNLDSGHYQLSLRAFSHDGQTITLPTIPITIKAAWWQHRLAYIAYFCLLALFISILIRFRTKHLQIKNQELEKIIESRIRKTQEQKQTIELLLQKNLELFANVSHEFRTPLTLIIGPAQRLLQQVKKKASKNDLETIIGNGQRLLRMVNQLLDMSRSNYGNELNSETINATTIIELLVKHFDSLLEQKSLTVQAEFEDSIYLQFDMDSFEKIVINLLSNAIKFSPPNSIIKINLYCQDAHAYLTVTDEGPGIAVENQKRIFERFVRIPYEQDKVEGAGIGLALVKQLVEHAGGSINVNSALQQGATFIVALPIGATNQQEEQGSIPATISNATLNELEHLNQHTTPINQHQEVNQEAGLNITSKERILIAEDNEDLQQFIKQSLSMHFSCLLADDGEQACKLALQEVPDLIITDLMMPKKDGFDLAKQIRNDSRTSHIPIIVLTAKADLDTRKFAWQLYVDEFIEKPFNADELLLRCQNIITIRRMLSQVLRTEILNTKQPEHFATINERDRKYLENLRTSVDKHFANPELNIALVCDDLAMSESQLLRKTKALLGQSVSEFIRDFRLQRAAEQLKSGNKIIEVAFATGFSSQSYFSRCFKQKYDMSPSQYQQTVVPSKQKVN